jgi:protein-L-isoaspartate(D-aspartate) O-methyltransferase
MTEAVALAERLRGTISDERVLAAIAAIPRERFVPEAERARAYDDVALPIQCGQTISQPQVVARMLALLELRPDDRVLDVGTGSGYHAALLSLLAQRVWTIERHSELSATAAAALAALGLDNIEMAVGDGWLGAADQAPFDAINVAAAASDAVPAELEQQLAPGGRMVMPVGAKKQHLTLTRRLADGTLERTRLESVRFVPLVRDPAR